MNKILISFLSIVLFASFTQAVNLKVKGSDTVLPLMQKFAEVYMKKNSGSQISVTGGGSGVGINALMNNTTDAAMSSRKMKLDEKMKVNEAGKAVKEVKIAQDALSIVVHPENKVSKLTREQAEGIFTGKIKNWKEIGGDDMQIIVYSRETSSGTYEFFKEKVLKGKNFALSALMMPASGGLVQSIIQTKGAVGYVGFAYTDKGVKTIEMSFDKGKTFVKPSIATAKNKTYPIARPLYVYFDLKREKAYKPFVDFMLSAEGQQLAEKVGYIALK